MKLPKAVTFKSAETLRKERLVRILEAKHAHTRMYEKLVKRFNGAKCPR